MTHEINKDCFTFTVSAILKNFSIVVAILANIIFIVWKAAQLDSRVQTLESSFQKIDGVNIRQEMMSKQLDRFEVKIDILMSQKESEERK